MRVDRELHLYTDGACTGARGGFGCVLVNPKTDQHIALADGPFCETTNNQMEMLAVIRGLEFVHRRIGAQSLLVFSDSQYVIKGITEWIHNWKRNGWFTSSNKLVKNAALWQRMEKARGLHQMTRFQWVKGHDGNRFNEMADRLAVSKRQSDSKARQLGKVA